VINPEVTQANIHQTICVQGWTATIGPTLVHRQSEEAAAPGRSLHGQEPCPLRRGPLHLARTRGQSSPFPPSLVGAKAKDKTETALHTAVCNGTLTLPEAQQIIQTDWFKYYRDHG